MDRRTFLKSSGAATVGGIATSTIATSSLAGSPLDATARSLTLAITPPHVGLDTALTARRISEDLERTTDARIQLVETTSPTNADLVLTSVQERLEQHPAWSAFVPVVHGFDTNDFTGWLTVGGGAVLIEQLETETNEKILFVGQRHAPHGLWADRELFGLHARPSLTIRSGAHHVLSASETGTGDIKLVLSDGISQDLESGRFEDHILHALPATIAGEPLVMTLSRDIWDTLSSSEQTVLTTLAAHEHARAIVEGRTANQIARAAMPLPTPVGLPGEFKRAIAAAINVKREGLSQSSPLAAEMFASQSAYRAITGAPDMAQVSSHFAS